MTTKDEFFNFLFQILDIQNIHCENFSFSAYDSSNRYYTIPLILKRECVREQFATIHSYNENDYPLVSLSYKINDEGLSLFFIAKKEYTFQVDSDIIYYKIIWTEHYQRRNISKIFDKLPNEIKSKVIYNLDLFEK